MKKSSVLALMAILAAVLFLSVGCSKKPVADTNNNNGKVDCTKQEAYTVDVPFNETEFYYVPVGVGRAFCQEEPYSEYDVKVSPAGKSCFMYISNKGNITGEWRMRVKFITTNAGGGPESDLVSHEIKPGETVKFDFTYDQSDTPMNCLNGCTSIGSSDKEGCAAPYVEVCKYSFYTNETRTRTVTKYKQETRYKTVPC